MKNLDEWLKENGIWFQIIDRDESIHTAESAASAGLDLERVTKSLVFLTKKKKPILAIIPGNYTADKKKIRSALNLGKINLAPFNEAEQYSGYEPGATPPVHHKQKMPVVIDERLLSYNSIYGGGGSLNKIIELRPEDVVELNDAVVADIIDNARIAQQDRAGDLYLQDRNSYLGEKSPGCECKRSRCSLRASSTAVHLAPGSLQKR